MGVLFEDDFLDGFGTWPLAYIPYGGPDFGELSAVAQTVGGGGVDAYYAAWIAAGDRALASAEAAGKAGHRASARELYLKASAHYAASYHPLYGAPVDPRLVAAFKKQRRALDNGLALGDPPARPQSIPFEGKAMPAYLLPATGFAEVTRPTIIFINGYDGTITDMFFASAVAASRRGYHALLFDGPGQGAMLYESNIPLRPDWETVVSAVVDFALTLPQVHPRKAHHQRLESGRLSRAARSVGRTPSRRLHSGSGPVVRGQLLPGVRSARWAFRRSQISAIWTTLSCRNCRA